VVVGLAGFPGLTGFVLIADEPEKSSVVCPSSRTMGIAGNGAIRAVNEAVSVVIMCAA
jgi:hypothetical protein